MIIRRRRALLAGGLALVTGCGRDGDAAAKRAREVADATAALRRRTAADSSELLRRYDATAAAHPALAARLKPLRAEVARHVTVFGGNAEEAAVARSASPSPSPSVSAAAVPASPDAALMALADAEQRLVDARTAALVDAVPEPARLLASVAAAGGGHVLLLKEKS